MPTLPTRSINPQIALAVGLGAAGTAKLTGAQFTIDNFKRWGYPDWWRPAIGATEVGTAVLAIVGLRHRGARKLAAAGALSTMGGAIATHVTAGEAAYNLIAPASLAGAGLAVLYKD